MKSLLIAVCTMGFVASQLSAQRAGSHLGGGTRRAAGSVQGRTNFGDGRFFGAGHGNFGGGFPWIYPAFYGDPDFGGDSQPQPNIFIVMPEPQAPPEPPPPPPPPPIPVVREYHWPASEVAPAPFSIVLNNGTVHYATMVWVENGRIHFNAPEGGARQVPLSSVSKTLTHAANAQKGLTLPLP
jgi:hypothetical protein